MDEIKEFSFNYWENELYDYENNIYLSNDIFDRLDIKKFNNGRHRLFAVVYLFVVSWIYRYGKSIDINDSSLGLSRSIKEMCGINNSDRKIDYIIKSKGVLDKLKITKTIHVSDAPLFYEFDKFTKYVTFESAREYIDADIIPKINSNVQMKEPLLGTKERVVNGVTYLGTFQDVEYTFCFSMRDYIYMSRVLKLNVEVIGFYIYLLSLSSYYGGVIKRSRIAMADELGLTEKTITKYKSILKEHGLINEYYNNPMKTQEVNTIIVKASDLYASSKTSSRNK